MENLSSLNSRSYTRTQNFRNNDGTGVVYTLSVEFAVGSQSRRWTGSPKTHILKVERIISAEWVGQVDSRSYKVGQNFSVYAKCNTNGQHTGTEYKGVDTDAITCERCLEIMGETVAAKPAIDKAAVRAEIEARKAERLAKAAAKAANAANVKRCAAADCNERNTSSTSEFCTYCRPYQSHPVAKWSSADKKRMESWGKSTEGFCGICGKAEGEAIHN